MARLVKYSNDKPVLYVNEVKPLDIINNISFKTYKNNKQVEYYNIPSSFDIETTSFYEKDEKRAIMYEWTFGINGLIIIGRTWKEFIDFIYKLATILKLHLDKRLLVYVHNLAFEFQFIRKWFEWENVFACDDRKPLYALTDFGIEFRCSYLLSGYSLAKVGQHLQTYKVEKMVGDLDYSLIRNSKTVLTSKELKYCINDVRVVMSYIQELIDKYGNILKLPLTKTGFVRNYVRKACFHKLKDSNSEENIKLRKKYINMISMLNLSVETYKMAKREFMGGFTHASCLNSGYLFKDVHSYDFTSAYPYCALSEKFPMDSGKEVFIKSIEELKKYTKLYCCIFDVEFTNIYGSEIYEHYIPSSKCYLKQNYVSDNGRVVCADKIQMTINEVDFEIIERFYKWDKMRIGKCYIFKKEYLPKEIIMSILKFYNDKTKLKDVEEYVSEYQNSKEMLNSIYGMMVTDICRNNIVYNDEWGIEHGDIEEQLNKYNKAKNKFLYYYWGIMITSYNRRNLFSAIYNLKEDYIYSDTDSVKFLNLEKHQAYFDNYNKNVVNKLEKVAKYYDIDFELFKPKTIKGVEKLIGVFDYEGKYTYFKTLGAKRYMTFKNDTMSITISGLNKKVTTPYLLNKYNNDIIEIFNNFKENMYIPKGYTGKQIHTYIDFITKGTIKDYQGNVDKYYELSSVHLEESDYSLMINEDYMNYLKGIKEVR